MRGAGKEDLGGVKLALALDVHSGFLLEAEIRVHSVFPNCECDGLDAALPKASRADRLSPSPLREEAAGLARRVSKSRRAEADLSIEAELTDR